ncbi:fusaric acid resistance protein [Acetobacter orientalis]|uniref:Fusaric acid resistance protein n=1 Tax=Acetobacter orientalis TaxID=146474 RepID=A0A2Z5ZL15_9PROT|nr:fusaric acid resistance protein [Acetobacter orientalis]
MSGTLYTRPTLRDKAENALVLAAAIAGRVWFALYDSPHFRGLFYTLFLLACFIGGFTETGQDITAYLLTIGFCIWDILAEMTGLPRLDVGGMV